MPAKSRYKQIAADIPPLTIPDDDSKKKNGAAATPAIDLPSIATLTIGKKKYPCSADDLEDLGELGSGAFGFVSKMRHTTMGDIMAVKRIRVTMNQTENKRLLMDYNVSMRSLDCPYTITFYGALFREGDVWICMELMDRSLDSLYQVVYKKLEHRIPEPVLGKIAVAVLEGLCYLHDVLRVMHRDVKPSNVLINRKGEIKLCDFGIAGELVNSLALTDIGSRPYLAPERIQQEGKKTPYDHRSDVWSYGITLYELATGTFPYIYRNIIEQITNITEGPPPRLQEQCFSDDFTQFLHECLTKEKESRPKYTYLVRHGFIQRMKQEVFDVAHWYGTMEKKLQDLAKKD